MKTLEKFLGINANDLKGAIPALKEVYTRLSRQYIDTTHPKLKMLDHLMIFCVITFVMQIAYAVVVGKDPFNSLLAGLFCSLG